MVRAHGSASRSGSSPRPPWSCTRWHRNVSVRWCTRTPVKARGLGGLDRLALAITVSALLLSPFAVETAPAMPSRGWPLLGAAGVIGVALAFSCDFTALKLAGTRVVATLFALDPVIGTIIGVVALSQQLVWTTTLGIFAIVTAGAVTTATHGNDRPLTSPVNAPENPHSSGLGDGT
jgi:uncharacterized membrane protein